MRARRRAAIGTRLRGAWRASVTLCLAGLAAVSVVFSRPTGASATTRPNAVRAAAEKIIASYLQGASGQPPVCAAQTGGGFFAGGASYLASCTNTGGNLQIFVILNAGRKPALDVDSPYLVRQLDAACQVGAVVYSAGVKGRAVTVFAGDGDAAPVAMALEQALARQLQNQAGSTSRSVPCR